MYGKIIIIGIIILALGIVGGAYYYATGGGTPVPVVTPGPTPQINLDEVLGTPTPAPAWPTEAYKKVVISTPGESGILISMVMEVAVKLIGNDAYSKPYGVTGIQGNYAGGTADSLGDGVKWLAVKVGGTWKLIFMGKGIIPCKELTDYPDFPKSMIPECTDAAGKIMVR